MKSFTYEDKAAEIDAEVAKRRGRWKLSAIAYMDFDDVAQIVKLHIYKKWNQWDQRRPLKMWLNRVITNQMINLVRNHYKNLAPPCAGCAFSLWGDHCEYTPNGMKCDECPLYRKWSHAKRDGYHIKMASSINNEEYVEKRGSAGEFNDFLNVEDYFSDFHSLMRGELSSDNFKIYQIIFLENHSPEVILRKISKIEGREITQKRVNAIRRNLIKVAKRVLAENDIFFE